MALAVFGALLLAAVLLDSLAIKVRVPGILLVLVLGLLTDNNLEALPGEPLPLLSLPRAELVAQVALVLVLFFGGLTTNWRRVRSVIRPATRLATAGSLITALLVMAVVLGLQYLPGGEIPASLPLALFVGAMVCSTDASAVLAMLRPLSGLLPLRLLALIEVESAVNDPVAVVFSGLALAMAGGAVTAPSGLVIDVVRQFLLGGLLGFMGGSIAQFLLAKHRSKASPSLLAVMSLAELMLLVGATELLGGSGLLAAFIAGLVLGNSPDGDQPALEEAHAGFTKLAELLLFLCMGLVVDPREVVQTFGWAVVLFLAMLLARWLMVQGLLVRSGYNQAEKLFVGMAGLRGAVPIAMAIQAAASGVSWGHLMPPLALGVVLLGLLGQGFALVPLARRLGLTDPPPALASPGS
ncbi:cation:proton antiporter [Synechococcus sp. CS-1325]|nr:cation:proton antiporter [Synechococcus sp. CS-1325]MCT0212170.1 cation:proton antiporter [Synechococcus sp. CS-1326]MCT0230435.1 cation:proton antiporter [Synechococcus sp. CS-1324]MCT0233367.1 cation:proton antiporter [Synechococcus sp. CS-1327]PZU98651.1 MAG: sodium:proton antiporter [Cyanobium sp.]